MFKPSMAPRWKIAMIRRRRLVAAAAVRARNPGAKPSDSIAMAPDFRKMRREVIALSPLEVGGGDEGGGGAGQLRGQIDARDERARAHPRVGGVVVAGGGLTHVERHAEILE